MRWMLPFITAVFCVTAKAQAVNNALQRGNEYYKQSQFDLAENEYRQALQRSPKNDKAQYNLALSLYRQKKFDEAEGVLKSLTVASDTSSLRSSAWYNTGVLYSKVKDLPASIEAYKAALRLNPDDTQARENLQKALGELRNQKNQKSSQKPSPGMSQKDAEQKLQQLQQKEQQLQQRLQGQNARKGTSQSQDW